MPQAAKKLGQQTFKFNSPPVIVSYASIVGPMEGQGPFGKVFDYVLEDDLFGEESWEKAESKMLRETLKMAIQKASTSSAEVDFLLAGDLLNQIVSANFAARALGIPFLGLYGACSTMAEALALGAMLIDGGFASRVVLGSSSHHNTSERQFRYPTEQGVQRPLWAQWTVTGAGALLLAQEGKGPVVTRVTVGKVLDLGVKDANDMGSAMAPAAADSLLCYFRDTGEGPEDYDLIVTGDLGNLGLVVARELLAREGLAMGESFTDCGVLIYYPQQDVHAGGSGCGCSAAMFCGPILKRMEEGNYRRILLVGTGALMSPLTVQQGESIPALAHVVAIEKKEEG